MVENKRFFIHEDYVCDKDMEIPVTHWCNESEKEKYCDELNNIYEENKYLKLELDNCKRELIRLLEDEVKKNGVLLEENNSLRIENMKLKEWGILRK